MIEKVYAFDCSNNPNLHGFTEDRNGANLPGAVCNGEWVFKKEIEVHPNTAYLALNIDALIESIEERGYSINGHQITFTESVDE